MSKMPAKTTSPKRQIASERFHLRVTPEQHQRWQRAAKERSTTVSGLIEEAVDSYLARDSAERVADFGRAVLEAARVRGLGGVS